MSAQDQINAIAESAMIQFTRRAAGHYSTNPNADRKFGAIIKDGRRWVATIRDADTRREVIYLADFPTLSDAKEEVLGELQ